ncbi:hypothetical protein OUZ56_014296 [Daphnia magna]|uniref:Uncharacterized protein n=1 Tax=Daphnia magna TaxID=35525 RepID=A0ABR0AJC0_9CRUS|nr:hypothetical protein OUZ56_014296 [Daphnia magna]
MANGELRKKKEKKIVSDRSPLVEVSVTSLNVSIGVEGGRRLLMDVDVQEFEKKETGGDKKVVMVERHSCLRWLCRNGISHSKWPPSAGRSTCRLLFEVGAHIFGTGPDYYNNST